MITIQTEQPIPNAVYVPQIIIQTGISGGRPVTSCQITLAAVKIDNPDLAGVDSGLRPPDFSSQAEAVINEKIGGGVLKEPGVEVVNNWTQTGQVATIYLGDLANLDEDMTDLGEQVAQFYEGLMTVIEAINATRKVL